MASDSYYTSHSKQAELLASSLPLKIVILRDSTCFFYKIYSDKSNTCPIKVWRPKGPTQIDMISPHKAYCYVHIYGNLADHKFGDGGIERMLTDNWEFLKKLDLGTHSVYKSWRQYNRCRNRNALQS